MKKYQIQLSDIYAACYLAVGTVVIPGLLVILESGTFPTKAQMVAAGIAGLAAGLSYLGKKFITDDVQDAKVTLLKADVQEQEKLEKLETK